MLITQPPVTVVNVIHEPIAKKAAAPQKELRTIRNPTSVIMEDLVLAVRALSRTHEPATGEPLAEDKLGFTLVDAYVPKKLQERLKEGERFNACGTCEAAEKEKKVRMGLADGRRR